MVKPQNTERFAFRLSPDDATALAAAARRLGLSRTTVLRALVRQTLCPTWSVDIPFPAVNLSALEELRRIGINLNQIARIVNSVHHLRHAELDATLLAIQQTIRALTSRTPPPPLAALPASLVRTKQP